MASSTWQCSKCGKQSRYQEGNVPPQSSCPNGGYHVWARM